MFQKNYLSVVVLSTIVSTTIYSTEIQVGDDLTLEVTLIDEYDFVNVYLNNQGWKMNVKDSVYYYWIPEILNLFGI